MENRKKFDPKKRKPIHENLDYNEIRDNVKNNAIVAQTRIRSSNSYLEVDSDPDTYSSDDEDHNLDGEGLSEEGLTTYRAENRPRRRQRGSTPFEDRVKPSPSVRTPKLTPKRVDSPVRLTNAHKQQTKNCSHDTWKYILFLIVFLIIIAYTSGCFNNFTVFTGNLEVDSKESVLENVKQTLLSLKSRYKNQDRDLWHEAYVGISELIKKPNKPSIIILLGDKSDPIDCLAILLGNVSSNALNSGRLTLTPNEFDHDMGSVIEDLRVKIRNNKAVIIWDLLSINVEALKAFHNLCDRINPLVEEVIFIITIIADNFDREKNPTEFVEKELFKKLSGQMKDDAIQPLITRITDGPILTVKPEPSITDCPLPKASKK